MIIRCALAVVLVLVLMLMLLLLLLPPSLLCDVGFCYIALIAQCLHTFSFPLLILIHICFVCLYICPFHIADYFTLLLDGDWREHRKKVSVVHANDENAMCWGIMDYFMSALLCISIQIIRSFVHFFSRILLLVGMFSVLGDVLVPRFNIKAKCDGIFGTKYYTFPFSNGQRAFIKIKRQKVNIARQSLRAKH